MTTRKFLTEMPEQTPDTPPRTRLKKAGLWFVATTVVLCCAAVIAVMSLIGTRVAVPDWVRAHVAEKINADLDGLTLAFGDMSILLQDNWIPEMAMRNVVITDDSGAPLIQLSNVQGTSALSGLLRGKIRPGSIRVSGAQVVVRRSADGMLNVEMGDAGGTVRDATTAVDLIEQIDDIAARPHFASLTSVVAENLTLRYEDARAGQAWNVDGGQIDIARDEDAIVMTADLALLGNRNFATTMSMIFRSEIGSTATDLTLIFEDMPAQDIAGQSPALSWLEALDAPISGGLSIQIDDAGQLGPLAASLDIGEGRLSPNDTARPIAFQHAGADLSYDPQTSIITFNGLELDSQWITTRIAGQTQLIGMEDGWPDTLTSQFKAATFQANPFNIYDQPIAFDAARLDMQLTLDPFAVRLGELAITDQGRRIAASADIAAGPQGWSVSASAHVPEIASDRLLELWPETLEPKTRTWITKNVQTVDLQNIRLAIKTAPDTQQQVYLGFDFDNLTSRFIKDVPVIERGRGTASINGQQFVISAHHGVVNPGQGGEIDITGSSFEIENITERGGIGVVRLKTDSSITAALALLNSGPFGFIDKAGQSVTVAQGHAALDGVLRFPVVDNLTPDGVDFTMTGTLSDVRSDTLVKDRVLRAARLAVDANSDRLRLAGPGQIGDVPFDGTYTMPLVPGSNGRATVAGWIELSERFMEEFRIGLPPGSVRGTGRGEITINIERGSPPSFTLNSDLDGLGLALRPLDWSLGEEATGALSVSGVLGQPPSIEALSLDAAGLRAQGSITLQPDGQLQQANFSRVQLGNWIDAPVDLVGLGPGRTPLIRVAGGTVDLRQTSLTKKRGGQANAQGGGPVSLRLDRLQIIDTIALTDFNAELSTAQGVSGDFTGKVNGQTAIAGRIVPQANGSAFIITSEDAGGVLRSANLLKQARDGDLQLLLVPGDGDGVYEGQIDATSLRVKDMPTMAALLNAISLVGILDQLNGDGIHFSNVEGRFQLAPDRVTIYEVAAVGASMGISMEGYYHSDRRWLDLDGVISPVYALNLGGWFGRPGEGLIGFGYDVEGEASNPSVSVNPLSALTPGIFRDIFRGPPPARPGAATQQADTVEEAPSTGAVEQADR